MEDDAWMTLNKGAITCIKMYVSGEILLDIKGLTIAYEVRVTQNLVKVVSDLEYNIRRSNNRNSIVSQRN